ncbi:MAG: 50S ribosomal protein L30 [Desulfurococcales archaeon]|nr:50S ribosomal protein L30 [Desulfurococcales archaeon]
MAVFLIIRLRGEADIHPDVEYTLNLLRLRQKFAASIYPDDLPGIREMLRKVEYWTTYGKLDVKHREVLVELIRRRGRLLGDKPITDEWVASKLGLYGGINELAEKLLKGELRYHELEKYGVKPFFRLHPPRGGFKKTIKRHYRDGGELGDRGEAIGELVLKML